MTPRLKAKILTVMRQLFLHSDVRKNVLKRSRVDKSLFQCELCGQLVYDGTSDRFFNNYKKKDSSILRDKLNVDHINPVVPPEGFLSRKWSWDIIVEKLFCYEQDLQAICKSCHREKTDKENQIRFEKRRIR